MTETAPRPIQAPTRHPPITVTARIPATANGLSWHDVLIQAQGRLELAILKQLDPSPWTILDGTVAWRLVPEHGERATLLEGVWTQE